MSLRPTTYLITLTVAGVLLAMWQCTARRTRMPSADGPTISPTGHSLVAPPANAGEKILAAAKHESPSERSPFKMRTLLFEFDGQHVHLTRAATVQGRVKAPPVSAAAHRLEFEVYDGGGRQVYAGAFGHPLREVHEHLDTAGEFHGGPAYATKGACLVRVPANLPAARIALFDVRTDPEGIHRHIIGSFNLP